jgi:hypothetical protein
MTPRNFQALLKRHEERERRSDYRAGIVAALLANQWRDKATKPRLPGDFFPNLVFAEPKREAMAADEMLKVIQEFRAARSKAAGQ